MIEVELPDGTIAEFPEGTSPDVMRSALQKRFANQSFSNDGTVGPTNWRKDVMGYDGSVNADNVMRTFITSAPVVGPLLGKAGAAIDAALDKTPIGSNIIPGDTWSERYENALASQKGKDEAFGREHPYVQTGVGVAGGIAGTVPMIMAAPAAFGAGGGGLIARGLASGASGMALGGTDAAIRSDFDPEAIKLGAGAGLVMGGIGPAAGQAIGAGARKIGDVFASQSAAKAADMVPSALRYLNKAAIRDGLDAPAIQQRLADLGPEAMLMDISPNFKGAAGALANSPGEAQTIIRDARTKRMAGANQRVVSGLDDALGPVANPRAIEEQIRSGQRAIDYGEPFRNSRAVNTEPIAQGLESASVNLRGPAQRAANDVRKMLNITGTDQLDPNPGTLFQTRQAIDGMLATETNPKAVALLADTRKQIDSVLADKVPGIKMADAQFQELARQNEGLRMGVKALDSGREALRPDELRQAIVEGVTPEGLMVGPSAQTFRMKQAARADIDRQVGTKANDVVALKNVLKGEGDWNRDRIGMLFGQERADKALSLLDREARFANTNNDVTGNSFTAARSAAQKELFPSDASSFGVREAFAAGGVRGAARNLGTRGLDRLVGVLADSGVDARNAGLGEALAGNKQAIINALDQLQSSKDISPQMQRLIQAMMLERGIKAGESAQGLLTRF
ncbi:hypothetical protein ABFV82_02555 [Brucella melitensis]